MIAAPDRLIEQADQCEAVAAWHEEQAGAGPPQRREIHARTAQSYRVVELCLRLVADALDDEDEDI